MMVDWLPCLVVLVVPIWAILRQCCSQATQTVHYYFLGTGTACCTSLLCRTLMLCSPFVLLLPSLMQASHFSLIWMVTLPVFVLVALFAMLVLWPIVGYNRAYSLHQYLEDRFQSVLLKRTVSLMSILAYLALNTLILVMAADLTSGAVPNPPIEPWMIGLILGVLSALSTFFSGQQVIIELANFAVLLFVASLSLIFVFSAQTAPELWTRTINETSAQFHNYWSDSNESSNMRLLVQEPSAFTVSVCGLVAIANLFTINQANYQLYVQYGTRKAQKGFILPVLLSVCLLMASLVLGLLINTSQQSNQSCTDYDANSYLLSASQLGSIGRFMNILFANSTYLSSLCAMSFAWLLCASLPSNHLAQVTLIFEDFLKNALQSGSMRSQLAIVRVMYLSAGFLTTLCGTLLLYFGADMVTALYSQLLIVLTALLAPVTAIYFCGIFWPCCNWKGAFVGLTTGLTLAAWLTVGGLITNYEQFVTLSDLSNPDCATESTVLSRLIDTNTPSFVSPTTVQSIVSSSLRPITTSGAPSQIVFSDPLEEILNKTEELLDDLSKDVAPENSSSISSRVFHHLPIAMPMTQTRQPPVYYQLSLWVTPVISLSVTVLVTLCFSLLTRGQDIYSALDWNQVYFAGVYVSCQQCLQRCCCCGCSSQSVNYNPAKICVPSESFKYANQSGQVGDELSSVDRSRMKYYTMETAVGADEVIEGTTQVHC